MSAVLRVLKYLALIALAWFVMAPFLMAPKPSEDLLALWLAARSIASGNLELVYAAADPIFTMRPPSDAWVTMAMEEGHADQIYPYLYPPLWAALVAPFTDSGSFPALVRFFAILNPLLLGGAIALAWRALRSPMPFFQFLLVGHIAIYGTTVGALALLQNQPQILVAFLTVLVIERCRSGAQIAAGIALALAAAIKLYPVLYAPVLLAAGYRKAFGTFVVAGGLLGLASIALAGWPLHAEFLSSVSGVSRTAMKVSVGYGLDTVLTLFIPEADMVKIAAANASTDYAAKWFAVEKSAMWIAASRTAMLAILALAAFKATRVSKEVLYRSLWPSTLIALAVLSPLAWAYYFIAAMSFAPSLLDHYGRKRGTAILVIVCLPINIFIPVVSGEFDLRLLHDLRPALGLFAMLALMLAFAQSARTEPAVQNGRTTLPE